MTDYPTIIFAALLIFLYGLISRVSEKSPITAPMVFAGIGILAGPMALNLLDVKPGRDVVKLIAEITLVINLVRGRLDGEPGDAEDAARNTAAVAWDRTSVDDGIGFRA